MNNPVGDISLISMINNADFVVKAVIIILLLASFFSWIVIFQKIFSLRAINHKTKLFEKIFCSGNMVQQLYEKLKNRADHPLAVIFVAAMSEWQRRSSRNNTINISMEERIINIIELMKNKEIIRLEKNLNILATIGSVAPFLGLFGTVWGIMNSFKSIATVKTASLAVVAPGIAEALFATAIGLVAAIPAVVFYNLISNKINLLVMQLDNFTNEFLNLITNIPDISNN